MKQVLYIFTAITVGLSTASAQIAAGTIASAVLTKPVVLADVNLKASFSNNSGAISWQATQQLKVRRYELEKSVDGENYSYITSFAGSEKSYSTADNNLFSSTNYYRLKIVDEEGNFFYSNVEIIDTRASANEIKILPTHIGEKIFVWVPANTKISSAVISDAGGRTIYNTAVSNATNIATIETVKLVAGTYSIQLFTNKGETIKLKYNKQS